MTTVSEIRDAIRRCDYLTLDPRIDLVLAVDRSLDLAEVGAAFVNGDTLRVQDWLDSGLVKSVKEDNNTVFESRRWVDVFPARLVQDT
jgi:hypothetical protein